MHQNQLEGLVNHRLLGPISKVLDFSKFANLHFSHAPGVTNTLSL